MLVYSQLAVFANYNDIYILDIKYDWINKSMVEKEAIISEIKDIIFDKPIEKQEDFKSRFKDKLKDKNHLENYYAASAGYKEFKGNNISAFYYKRMKTFICTLFKIKRCFKSLLLRHPWQLKVCRLYLRRLSRLPLLFNTVQNFRKTCKCNLFCFRRLPVSFQT